MMNNLSTYIRSGVSCIQVITHEEDRAIKSIKNVAGEQLVSGSRPGGYDIWHWSITKGLRDDRGNMVKIVIKKKNAQGVIKEELIVDTDEQTKDPVVALKAIMASNIPPKSVIIMKDFHMNTRQQNPSIIRLLRDAIDFGKKSGRHIIIVGCQAISSPELEKEITTIELPLPGKPEINEMLIDLHESPGLNLPSFSHCKDKDIIIDSMCGMTINEASDAALFSIAKHKRIDPELINTIKTDTIKKNGVVEIVNRSIDMDDIGGLKNYKRHIKSISKSFTKEARDYGLPSPQSILAVGQAGTGKSMSSEALKTALGLKLLRIEAGRLFGSYVGESERNWRTSLSMALAMAPCILWMDEAEGLFSGTGSSGRTDGGTTSRVVKAILQDMQDTQTNDSGVFFVFTSNDIDGFPDPLIDRCDVWSFDLPTREERESIWSIHIRKRKRNPDNFDLKKLSERTEGFSGRQIEQAWLKSMTVAFNDKKREPTTEDSIIILDQFIPTSVTMKVQIERRRERLKNRAQSAS